MSRTLNKVMLIGNVGRNPELKYTPSGIPVISFRLATSESWKDRDGNVREHTDWHTIVAWRGLAEVINKIVNKGSRIYIEGRIQTRVFDDKSGHRKHIVEILADNMLLLDAKKHKGKNYHKNNNNNNNNDDDDNNYEDDDNDYQFDDPSDDDYHSPNDDNKSSNFFF